MAKKSKIQWTDATFNPWMGCTKVSPACDHCYAAVSTPARTRGIEWGAGKPRARTTALYWDQPRRWNATPFYECSSCGWRGEAKEGYVESHADFAVCSCPECTPAQRDHVLRLARRRVFCASLADVFDNEVPVAWRADLLMLIRATPNLDWQLLTKRIGNVHRLLQEACDLLQADGRLDGWDWLNDWINASPPANVWLGATIANQEEADRDVVKLLAMPARVHFLSMEPLLGPVDLTSIPNAPRWAEGQSYLNVLGGYAWEVHGTDYVDTCSIGRQVDWVIVGGESGDRARAMEPAWPLDLRDQCARSRVPFFFKQWGEWSPDLPPFSPPLPMEEARAMRTQVVNGTRLYRLGVARAGRELDGVTHDGMPHQVVTA